MIILNVKYFAAVLIVSASLSSLMFAQHQHSSDSTKKEMKMGCCMGMSHSETEMKSDSTEVSDQVIIDVEKIDKNKDGKVFIDGMCKDVVKDEPGDCPNCGMELKEVTLDTAKKFVGSEKKLEHKH